MFNWALSSQCLWPEIRKTCNDENKQKNECHHTDNQIVSFWSLTQIRCNSENYFNNQDCKCEETKRCLHSFYDADTVRLVYLVFVFHVLTLSFINNNPDLYPTIEAPNGGY